MFQDRPQKESTAGQSRAASDRIQLSGIAFPAVGPIQQMNKNKSPAQGATIQRMEIKEKEKYTEGELHINIVPAKDNKGVITRIAFNPKPEGNDMEEIYIEQIVKQNRFIGNKASSEPLDPLLEAALTDNGFYNDMDRGGIEQKKKDKKQVFEQLLKKEKLHYYINAGLNDEFNVDKKDTPSIQVPTGEKVSEPEKKIEQLPEKTEDNTKGSRINKKVKPALLYDAPNYHKPVRSEFYASAINHDNGSYLGHVFWGYETVQKNPVEFEDVKMDSKFFPADNKDVSKLQEKAKSRFYKAVGQETFLDTGKADKDKQDKGEKTEEEKEVDALNELYDFSRMTNYKDYFDENYFKRTSKEEGSWRDELSLFGSFKLKKDEEKLGNQSSFFKKPTLSGTTRKPPTPKSLAERKKEKEEKQEKKEKGDDL